ncbi:[citrate (pro-3S)-lyase] ligase [Maledivibacter halophilus]|uniref:[Citrate [pro-3S]-lyase] ligase n=1 Tax=Maledivibacter halophilus TaxID=36842 RepID=A0A1T5JAQ6_9FIRM|nr:[citrate (pro-3S)-lyase] ligase [Maledivibacter halophilus]SKC48323.1 [citrate (pro-3S)-lyase] ligase [Maledivibacter halophilus]
MVPNKYQIEKIDINNEIAMKKVLKLLKKEELSMDSTIEEMLGIFYEEKLIATGGIKGNTLRCIAVDKDYQGGKIFNILIGELIKIQYHNGVNDIFVFTKPSAQKSFENLGFYVVEKIKNGVALMENRPDGLKKYLDRLSKDKRIGERISSIVMNGNPFTLGHRYLIEKVAGESDYLHIFVLSSEESSFPYEARKKMIIQGTKDIKNLIIHKGGDYIISNSTFPSYFIKEKTEAVKIHTILDLKIFGKYIASCLGINIRYVGHEPYCPITNEYNQTMKKILPKYGVMVEEIPRKAIEGRYISASRVRELIDKGKIEKIKSLVPKSTYDFLLSQEGKKVINKIQRKSLDRRH